jgi:hypothetical protein
MASHLALVKDVGLVKPRDLCFGRADYRRYARTEHALHNARSLHGGYYAGLASCLGILAATLTHIIVDGIRSLLK